MKNNVTMTSFLDNRKVLWGAGGAAGECRCVAAQRSLHEVASGINLFSHSNMYLDDGSSSLPSICKTIPSDRRSIPSTSKRPYNVQITAQANCDRRQRMENARKTQQQWGSRGRGGCARCLYVFSVARARGRKLSKHPAAPLQQALHAHSQTSRGTQDLSVPAMRVAGEDVQERGQVAAAVDFA